MLNEANFYSLVKQYKFIANKSLGQNFLIEPRICENIIQKLEISDCDNSLEIGGGLGSLTYFLSQQKGKKTIIDIDENMLRFLRDNFENISDLQVKYQNILKLDLSIFTKIVGNLPYYITSSIIEHILLSATNVNKVVLMCQKEVFPKLLPSNISPLSILLNYVGKISGSMNVSRNSFTPIPHVDSVVFEFIPNENIKNQENKELYKLICAMFLHRRKTILNCLTAHLRNKEDALEALNSAGINVMLRPEQINIEQYKTLFKVLKS